MTRDEHEKLCEDRHDSMMTWAKEVIRHSEDDRRKLWDETDKLSKDIVDLEKLIPRLQWWLIGILVSVIIGTIVVPRISNGTKHIEKTLTAIESKQARHEQMGEANNAKLKTIMKKLNIQYDD